MHFIDNQMLKKLYGSRLFSLVLPFIIYSVLAVIILWDLLLPGYILTLDMVFTPTIPFPREFYGFDANPIRLVGLPFHLCLWILNLILPSWLIQKALLFMVFLVAGLGAYMLCEAKNVFGKLFAGFMYVLNPFVYVRFMVGHFCLLLAYSIFPFLIGSFVKFSDEPQLERGIKLAFLLALVLILDVHFVYISGLAFIVLFIFKILSLKFNRQYLIRLIGLSGVTLGIFMMMNSYWIFPLFMFRAEDLFLSEFTYRDLLAFASRIWGTGLNIFFTLASLYGFWRMPEGYKYVSEILLGWQLIYMLILYFSVSGFISFQEEKSRRWIARGIAAAGAVSLVLAAGISSPSVSYTHLTLPTN